MSETCDVLISNAAEVLTMARGALPRCGEEQQDLGLLRDASVAIKAGKVLRVGPAAKLKGFQAKRRIDASGWVVLPGFVDAHTHLVFAGHRAREVERKAAGASYQDFAREGGGILGTVRDTRAASRQELLRAAGERLARMLALGTTTAEVKSGYALTPDGEVRLLEVVRELQRRQPVSLVPTFLGAHAVPGGMDADAYIAQLVDEALPRVAKGELARFCDVFVEQGYFDAAQARRLLKAARKLGLRAKVHADELTRCGGAELAVELGAASADHCLRSSERGLRELARTRTPAVLLPSTPWANFMKGTAEARQMIAYGVPVALGSDLSPGAWNESMLLACQLAVYSMRMLPSEALVAATINAACATGVEREVGSLAPGKRADVLLADVGTWHELCYRMGSNPVALVVKDGKVVARNGVRTQVSGKT